MTRARRLALAVGLPIALAIIGWSAFSLVTWMGQASYTVNKSGAAHGRRLGVAFDTGHVTLYPSSGRLIHLTGTTHYSLFRPGLVWQPTAAGTQISAGCPLTLTGPGCSFNYRIAVPAGLAVSATVTSGTLTASGLHSGVSLSADAADLQVNGAGGEVRLTSNSGDITATGLTGPDVVATLDAGDVSLTFTQLPRSVKITETAGNVTVVLPRGRTSYRVHANTVSGTSNVNVPTDPSSSRVINVTAVSGDISITQGP